MTERTLRTESVVSVDRTSGQEPLSIDVTGDRKTFWAATTPVPPNGFINVFLTNNRRTNGEPVFKKIPASITIWEDDDNEPAGIARATGPSNPNKAMNLKTPTNASTRLIYFPGNEVWAVQITNLDSSTHGFLVTAEGF